MRTVLIAPGRPSWVEMDVNLLRDFGPVTVIDVLESKFWKIGKWLPAFWRADLCYFWFGSFRHLPYLLIARLLGKKILVVAGGYDVNKLESISYGALNRDIVSRSLRHFIFRSADIILAVSEFTRHSALENYALLGDKVRTVPLAFHAPVAAPLTTWTARPRQVLFLLSARDGMFLVKGVDRIPEICRRLPDVQFKLAGGLGHEARAYLDANPTPNLERLGWVPFQSAEYIDLLNQTRVVCLPSRIESFGAAMVDGAVFGCLPVAFAIGALPEVIAGLGRVVEGESVVDLAAGIGETLNRQDVDVEAVRFEAISRFSLVRRREGLARAIKAIGALEPAL